MEPDKGFGNRRTLLWVYGWCGVLLAANAVCMINEFYWLNLLPAVLLVAALAIFALDKLLLICVFLTPLSINLANQDIRIGLSLPVEPLLAGILLLSLLKFIQQGKFDRQLLAHPVTIAILINLAWVAVTTMTSEMPLVSLKFLIARLWFIVPFYFLGVLMFRDLSNTRKFLWLYILPFSVVIGYTVFNHSLYGFDQDSAHWVMSPFYNDHTAYGAALAMFFPAIIAFAMSPRYGINVRIIAGLLLLIFLTALIFSYTRAAWVSLIGAFLLFVILRLRIKFMWLATVGISAFLILAFSWTDILMKLEKNRQDTSDDLAEHIESISNISTDASNLERLNRWSSAMRMFEERPIFGWGPGTYSFQYAPFQLSNEKTIISTNAGDLGNAHSEYIGPLCESGVFGLLSMLGIVVTILWTGWRLYHRMQPGEMRSILLAVLLGLVTYFIHGTLNNFLDTDKAAIPFWAFAAMLVAADLWLVPEKKAKVAEG
ncbi:MAG: O-antigen ligase family protein [Bacteroidia bacterium]